MKLKVIDYGYTKLPNRAHYNDSGADVFAVEDTVLKPGKVTKVRTGLGVVIPDGYDAIIHCKSGLSSSGILAANAPIDAGYRGEIHAILFNSTDHDIILEQCDKIGQLVIRPVIYADFVEYLGDERGDGGFGSTGK